jgi:PPM family protein phosphatase
MSGLMECSGMTNIGLRRTNNEDQYLIADVCKSMRIHKTSLAFDHQTRLFGETQGKLLLIADGMGGHEAGERASQVVTDGIVDYILNRLVWFMSDGCFIEDDFEEELRNAILSCQRRIDREIAETPQRSGMGSTLTMAYIVWPYMFLAHVGDSRCYLLRNDVLKLLTRDHTLGQLTAESTPGTLDRPERKSNSANEADEDDFPDGQGKLSNVLWNVLGGGKGNQPMPDVKALELHEGDKVMLCSDGLSNMLTRTQIQEILRQNTSTDSICGQLIEAANAAGGMDNISVVVSHFSGNDERKSKSEEIVLPLENSLADTVDELNAK